MTPTCAELAIDWTRIFPRPEPTTNTHLRERVRCFAVDFGSRGPGSITVEEAHRWALEHPGHYRYVRAMFNDALDAGWIRANPFASVRMRRRRRVRVPIPELDEVAALIAAAPAPLDSMIRFAAFTGLRLGEQLALTPADLEPGFVSVDRQLDRRGRERPPKLGSAGRVLCPAQALPVPPRGGSERLWAYPRASHHDAWWAAQREVGTAYKWHALRHFCATWMVNLGATAEDVAAQLRHVDNGAEVRRTYMHPDPALAIERLRALTA